MLISHKDVPMHSIKQYQCFKYQFVSVKVLRQEQKISEMVSMGDISFPSTMRTPTYFLGWSCDFNTRSGGVCD